MTPKYIMTPKYTSSRSTTYTSYMRSLSQIKLNSGLFRGFMSMSCQLMRWWYMSSLHDFILCQHLAHHIAVYYNMFYAFMKHGIFKNVNNSLVVTIHPHRRFQTETKFQYKIFYPNQITCQIFHRTIFWLRLDSNTTLCFLFFKTPDFLQQIHSSLYSLSTNRWACSICIWKIYHSSIATIWIQ